MISSENRAKIKRFLEESNKVRELAMAISAVGYSEDAYHEVHSIARKIGVASAELIEYCSEDGNHNIVAEFLDDAGEPNELALATRKHGK